VKTRSKKSEAMFGVYIWHRDTPGMDRHLRFPPPCNTSVW